MFGYVVPEKPELKIKDYEVFRSYYCGLCNEIGRISYPSKLTLTYDMAFLALVLSSLYMDMDRAEFKFCPYKLSRVPVLRNDYIVYAAELNIFLSNRKLTDNVSDDKSIIAYGASKVVKPKKGKFLLKERMDFIDGRLAKIKELEDKQSCNIDEISHYFGEITGNIFDFHDDKNNNILYVLGYNLGKWIYILDAFDDLMNDIKRKRYNPLIYRFNYCEENPLEFRKRITENIEFTLIKCLNEISNAFELLQFKKNRELIENIIYMGLERKTREILKGGCCNEKSIRGTRNKRRSITG